MPVYEYKPMKAYDLKTEIRDGLNVELSHSNFQFKIKEENGAIHSYDTLYSLYHNILTPYIITYVMNETEYAKYYQKPKLLSYDLYGTPEFWSGLLYINNMVSVANFTKRKIKVFNSKISDVMNEIMTIYHDDLLKNKSEVYRKN